MAQRNPPKKASTKTAGKETPPKRRNRTPWNTREILYAVFGYLTTREKPLIFGSDGECGSIAEIIGKIAEANGLPAMRKHFPKIHIPDGLEGITNVPEPKAQVNGEANPIKVVEDPLLTILRALEQFTHTEQNAIIKNLLSIMIADRHKRIDNLNAEGRALQNDMDSAQKSKEEFKGFISGILN